MKLYRITRTVAVSLGAVLALVAGGATASARPASGFSAAAAERVVNVMLARGSIVLVPRRVAAGQTTLVVRNQRDAVTAFVLARHTGGLNSLPRFYGRPFVPREEIVGSITQLNPDGQKRLRLVLGRGNYLMVTSSGGMYDGGGPILVDTAMPIAVH